jgi:hypothetical protein
MTKVQSLLALKNLLQPKVSDSTTPINILLNFLSQIFRNLNKTSALHIFSKAVVEKLKEPNCLESFFTKQESLSIEIENKKFEISITSKNLLQITEGSDSIESPISILYTILNESGVARDEVSRLFFANTAEMSHVYNISNNPNFQHLLHRDCENKIYPPIYWTINRMDLLEASDNIPEIAKYAETAGNYDILNIYVLSLRKINLFKEDDINTIVKQFIKHSNLNNQTKS